MSLAAFGLSTLAAFAFQWLLDGDVPRRSLRTVLIASGVVAAVTYVAIAWVLIAPALPIRGFFGLAIWAGVPSPLQGAEFLLYRARPLLSSLLLKLLCAGFLIWVAASSRESAPPAGRWRALRTLTRREQRLALAVLSVFVVVDLLVSNAGVNPTVAPELMQKPEWAAQIPAGSHQRVYIGGRLEGYINTSDDDAPRYATANDELTMMEQRTLVVSEYVFQPSGFGLRESIAICPSCGRSTSRAPFAVHVRRAPPSAVPAAGRHALRAAAEPAVSGAKPLAQMRRPNRCTCKDRSGANRAMIVPTLLGPNVDGRSRHVLERFLPVGRRAGQ